MSAVVPPTHKRTIGLWILTSLVAGNMIGSGIFLLPASLASYGSISILSWIMTSIGAILLALVFAKLGSLLPKVGGPYAYARAGFGNFAGFQIAYNYWIALWVGNAAIVVALISYLSVFWPALKSNDVLSCSVAIAIVWILTFINIIGVRTAGVFQLITTILKLLPLIFIATVGLFYLHPHYLADFNVSGKSNFSALTSAATLTFWAFVGLESATVPADDVIDPQRTIPRATILGTIIAASVYILSTIAIMGVLPMSQLAKSVSPYADAARIMLGPAADILVALGALISCLGALNGWTLLQGQIPYAAARDGLFPAIFAKESRFGTPIVGLISSSILITILLLLTLNKSLVAQFTLIILIATLASLIPYLYTCMAELMIFLKLKDQINGKHLIRSSIIAILAMIYAFWVITGSGHDTVFYGALLFLSSVPVYVLMRWQPSHVVKVQPEI